MSTAHRFFTRLVLFLCAAPAMAQSEVRRYPDPGHRWLGVYAGGPEQHFDYFLRKLSLGDTFPDKSAWWAGVKALRSGRDDAHRHDVFTVFCGERDADLETGKRRLDAWLAPDKDSPTYPELIPAICLGEENTHSRVEVLDGLARHIREKYRIPVLQWFSDPLTPDPNLTADGWIWDSYGRDTVSFRKHLLKFVVLRKPAICVPWAADPHWPQWAQYPTAAALIDREWRQFDVCREFDVACAVFAVAGPHGSVNTWAVSSAPELIKLRNALAAQREAMHAIRPQELPLSSADISARDRSVSVGGDPEAPSEYIETFSGFDWIHAADVRGFLSLRLTSQPDPPGFLELAPREDGPASASLVYRFESWFPLDRVEITLDAIAPASSGARNVLSLTTEEAPTRWPLEMVQQKSSGIGTLHLEDKKVVQGKHVFFVRIRMENPDGQRGDAANRLDRLRVRCVHQPPQPGASVQLAADDNDALSYEDDFQTARWAHLGAVASAHPSHGGFRDGCFWVGLKGGTATSTRLLQRISSPRPLQELTVTVDCYADSPNLGGSVNLSIAPRDGEPRWSVTSEGRHDGLLSVIVPGRELEGLREFDVHVTLSSNSGVEQGDKACAVLRRIQVQAK